MFNHTVGIRPQTGFSDAAIFQVGFIVHTGGVKPGKEWLTGFYLTFHKVVVGGKRLFVNRTHTFHGQRTGIFNLAVSGALNHAAWAKFFTESRVFRIVRVLRFFFSVQVVQVAEKLIKTVCGRQELIAIAKVVFTKLAGGITELFKRGGNRNVFFLQTLRRARHTDFTHPGTKRHLAGNKCRTTSS